MFYRPVEWFDWLFLVIQNSTWRTLFFTECTTMLQLFNFLIAVYVYRPIFNTLLPLKPLVAMCLVCFIPNAFSIAIDTLYFWDYTLSWYIDVPQDGRYFFYSAFVYAFMHLLVSMQQCVSALMKINAPLCIIASIIVHVLLLHWIRVCLKWS